MPQIPHNYAEARRLADEARARAFIRVDQLREMERNHRDAQERLPRHARPQHHTPFDLAVNKRVDNDAIFKAAVADNRWYIDYATMYAQGEILNLLRDIVIQVKDLK